MNTELTSQLEQLWGWLPRPTDKHVVRLFARNNSGRLIGDYARSLGGLVRFVESLDGRYNLYVALNPTTSTIGTRHSASEVTHWSYFPVDLDPVGGESQLDFASKIVSEFMQRTFSLTHSPIIIDSGRGRQMWYRLADYELSDDGALPRSIPRRAMKYWLGKISDAIAGDFPNVKIDPTVSDLPRVMRLPGTINLKTGRRGCIIHGLTDRYPTLGEDMISKTPKEALDTVVAGVVQLGASWQELMPHLTKSAAEYLMTGASEPGRHSKMWHLVTCLKERGADSEQAEIAAHHANTRRPGEELSTTEVERIITQVYGG